MQVPVYQTRLVQTETLELSDSACTDPYAVRDLAHQLIGDMDREHLLAIFVDGKNHIRGVHTVGIGTDSGLSVSIPTLFRAAIVACAYGVVFIHNHPSGNPEPSRQDIDIAEKIREASKTIGIPVLDNLIVTRDPKVFGSF